MDGIRKFINNSTGGALPPFFYMRLNLRVYDIDSAMDALARGISVTITASGGDKWQKEGEEETRERYFELTLKHEGSQS